MIKKIHIFFFYILFYAVNAAASTETLTILINGEVHGEIDMLAIKKQTSMPIEYYDHATKRTSQFLGTLLLPLIKSVIQDQLNSVAELEIISLNGYKSYITIENINKVEAVLTYGAVNGEKFERYSQSEKKMVPLGPYYLVWNFKTLGEEDRMQYTSVYQISKINFITNKVDFGLSGKKSSEAVELGFRTYKKYCLNCHAIGEWGGKISMDLLKYKILEIKGPEYMIKYALNPGELNAQTKMLPLPKYKNREKMAQGLVEFLHFAKNPSGKFKEISKELKNTK